MKTEPNDLINPSTTFYNEAGQRVIDINNSVVTGQEYGLTKREYFAAMAMQGLIANSSVTEQSQMSINHFSAISRDSITIANYLIEELNK